MTWGFILSYKHLKEFASEIQTPPSERAICAILGKIKSWRLTYHKAQKLPPRLPEHPAAIDPKPSLSLLAGPERNALPTE